MCPSAMSASRSNAIETRLAEIAQRRVGGDGIVVVGVHHEKPIVARERLGRKHGVGRADRALLNREA